MFSTTKFSHKSTQESTVVTKMADGKVSCSNDAEVLVEYSGKQNSIMCITCAELELERTRIELRETLSELNSMKLAATLLYADSDIAGPVSEVRPHLQTDRGEVSSPTTWQTVKPKYYNMCNRERGTKVLQHTEPVLTSNRYEVLSNLPEQVPRVSPSCNNRRKDLSVTSATKLRTMSQRCMTMHPTMEYEEGSHQYCEYKHYLIPTIINGHANPPPDFHISLISRINYHPSPITWIHTHTHARMRTCILSLSFSLCGGVVFVSSGIEYLSLYTLHPCVCHLIGFM
jgi:hypothetical protein